MARESSLARTFVELADSLVADFDVVDLLTVLADSCVEVLDVGAAGLMLGSPEGDLRVVASSNETVHLLELFELQADEGPCVDCYRSGHAVVQPELEQAGNRWPRFAPRAVDAGFGSVQALPMRLRSHSIGALNMFRIEKGPLSDEDAMVAQALADVATIAILQHRATRDAQLLNDQLTEALHSRIVIEQAKGVVAEQADVDMDEAFARLRAHARTHNLRLADVAEAITSKAISADSIAP